MATVAAVRARRLILADLLSFGRRPGGPLVHHPAQYPSRDADQRPASQPSHHPVRQANHAPADGRDPN